MSLDQGVLQDLEIAIADQIFIQVASWNLYLGDAGLAKSLAVECMIRANLGPEKAVAEALLAVQVPLGAAKSLSLAELIPSNQVDELKDLISRICL